MTEECRERPEPVFIPGPTDMPEVVRNACDIDAARIVSHAATKYGVAFGAGLGAGRRQPSRIGHLGSVTGVMMLSGLATAEMAMADLGLPVRIGSGVAAAQEVYRKTGAKLEKAAV